MKKWYAEEYEFTVEVMGFLRSDHTERYCRNGEEIGDKYTHLWLPGQSGRAGHLLQNHDDAVPAHGSGAERGRSGERRRERQIYQGYCVPGRLRAVPADGKAARERKFLKGKFTIKTPAGPLTACGGSAILTLCKGKEGRCMQAKKIWAMYWSATGTTKTVVTAVAGKLADRLGLPLEEYDFTLPAARQGAPDFGPEDVVVFGTPTYAGRVPNPCC